MTKIVILDNTEFVAVQTTSNGELEYDDFGNPSIWAMPSDEWKYHGGTIDDPRVLAVFYAAPDKVWAAIADDNNQVISEWHGPFDNQEQAIDIINAVYSLEMTILFERKKNREKAADSLDSYRLSI